jgi:hypothetical protein
MNCWPALLRLKGLTESSHEFGKACRLFGEAIVD